MPYQAPVKEMRFMLEHIAGLGDIAALPAYAHATSEDQKSVV
ncbi:MAG TPA: hypothetical protein DIW20_01775, partial [Rhodospirillaceae bacterium]|nr:hypothetical protein [Rhodospirillaceae bacterium]